MQNTKKYCGPDWKRFVFALLTTKMDHLADPEIATVSGKTALALVRQRHAGDPTDADWRRCRSAIVCPSPTDLSYLFNIFHFFQFFLILSGLCIRSTLTCRKLQCFQGSTSLGFFPTLATSLTPSRLTRPVKFVENLSQTSDVEILLPPPLFFSLRIPRLSGGGF